MKRILDCGPEDFTQMDGTALLDSVRRSEGRTLLCEVLWPSPSLVDGATNGALAVAFGADLVLLNKFDGDDLPGLKKGLGRPVGVNVEPSDDVPPHRRASRENLERLRVADFVVVTANPDAEVGVEGMAGAVDLARDVLPGTPIFVGKMHGSGGRGLVGVGEISRLAEAADAVLVPAPGTVPGSREEAVARLVDAAHDGGALAVAAVGTRRRGRTRRRCGSSRSRPNAPGPTCYTWETPGSRGLRIRRTSWRPPSRSGAGATPTGGWR